jgi:hypothetical protein
MIEPLKTSLRELLRPDRRPRSRTSTAMCALALRTLSAISLGLALSSGVLLIALRVVHFIQPNLFPWTLKSAVPLILIGVSFASFQFVVSRSRTQLLLGLMVSLAFILWGTEQFLSDGAVVSFIDDVVVFLFVLDLGIVIYGQLKPGIHAKSSELPLDSPDD